MNAVGGVGDAAHVREIGSCPFSRRCGKGLLALDQLFYGTDLAYNRLLQDRSVARFCVLFSPRVFRLLSRLV